LNGVGHVAAGKPDLGELGSYSVRSLNAHGRKDDLTVARFHLEILALSNLCGYAARKRQLVF
jgi:hypothetical protein